MKFNKITLATVFTLSLTLSGCVRMIIPTSETALVNTGVQSQMTINTDSITAYSKLKHFMENCVVYYRPDGYVTIKSNLNRENQTATLIGQSNFDTYLFKAEILPISDKSSTLIFTQATPKIGIKPKIEKVNKTLETYKQVAEQYQRGMACNALK